MSDKPVSRICIVDDDPMHNSTLCHFLEFHGYQTVSFDSATAFLAEFPCACDLVISDIRMPGKSGLDLCRIVREHEQGSRMPIILLTANDVEVGRAAGIESGADDFIGKPFPPNDLLAKVRSLLEIRSRDERKTGELVQARRFISPNVANLLTHNNQDAILTPHRAEVTVMFVDLRRFTPFSARTAPEEVLDVLGRYYTAVGNAAIRNKGTLGHLAGDGIMIFFNDPEPIANHRQAALRTAIEARDNLAIERKRWNERRYDLDFGIGLSEGFATLGGIGFEHFSQYTVIGTVTNLAARLCSIADNGQILITERYLSRLNKDFCKSANLGKVSLKGIDEIIPVYNILSIN